MTTVAAFAVDLPFSRIAAVRVAVVPPAFVNASANSSVRTKSSRMTATTF